MARHPHKTAERADDDEPEGPDEPALAPRGADAPEGEAPETEFTKAWRVTHQALGSLRVLADTEDEAVKEFIRVKTPGLAPAKLKPELTIFEIPFHPAETEKDKPFGWKKKAPKK